MQLVKEYNINTSEIFNIEGRALDDFKEMFLILCYKTHLDLKFGGIYSSRHNNFVKQTCIYIIQYTKADKYERYDIHIYNYGDYYIITQYDYLNKEHAYIKFTESEIPKLKEMLLNRKLLMVYKRNLLIGDILED